MERQLRRAWVRRTPTSTRAPPTATSQPIRSPSTSHEASAVATGWRLLKIATFEASVRLSAQYQRKYAATEDSSAR